MLDPRPVGVAFGRGQQACQAAGQASDLQTSGGDDRVGHRAWSEELNWCFKGLSSVSLKRLDLETSITEY